MRKFIILLINIALLTIALTTGFLLIGALIAVVTGIILFFVIRQKLTGRPPFTVRMYTHQPMETPSQTPVIDAEFTEVKDKKN